MGKNKNSEFKVLFKHIVLIIIVTLVLIWLSLQFLKIYTNHNKTYVVGDYTGLTLNEIYDNPQNSKLEFIVIDSIYDNLRKKQSVVTQSPLPNSFVKKNRKIYLTIVASQVEMVASPNLEDLTIRQAYAVLQSHGLNIGKIEYVEDIGNTVIRWKCLGKTLKLNDEIEKGSRIDLVVGNHDMSTQIEVPNLIGKGSEEARNLIMRAGLNVGKETFSNRKPENEQKVVKQYPETSEDTEILLGTAIQLWYE